MKKIKITFFVIFSLNFFSFQNCKNKNILTSQKSKKILELKEFAERYKAENNEFNNHLQLPEIDSNLAKIILIECDSMKRDCEKYLTLIILKMYKAHLKCCNQTYEIRNKLSFNREEQPILYQFLKITGIYDPNIFVEFIPSSISYQWVKNNQELMKYKPIRSEIREIERILKNIEKGKL